MYIFERSGSICFGENAGSSRRRASAWNGGSLVIGGAGWLYGGLVGAVAFKLMHDLISNITPQYWTFWMGLFLVSLMLIGRERLSWAYWKRRKEAAS